MALLNYTTTIDPIKTAGEIEYTLIKHGAKSILKECQDGRVIALSFMISTPGRDIPIRLPINVEPVFEVLRQQKVKGDINGKISMEQAERVAWRILKDWVEAQMAIVETNMVRMEQVFLSHITNADGVTLFEVIQSKHFLLGTGK